MIIRHTTQGLEEVRTRLAKLSLLDVATVVEALAYAEECEEGPDGIEERRKQFRGVTNVLNDRPRQF